MKTVRYPEISVQLSGKDGNAYSILGMVTRALKQAGIEKEEIDKFIDNAMSQDYDHLLRTCMDYVTVK